LSDVCGGKAAARWNGFKSFIGSGKEKVEKKAREMGWVQDPKIY
jgi:hypothetical protein